MSVSGKLRAGVHLIGGPQWLGGVTYSDLIVRALHGLPAELKPEIVLLVDDRRLDNWHLFQPLVRLADGIVYFGIKTDLARRTLPAGTPLVTGKEHLKQYVDAVYPFQSEVWSELPGASWIPDFQHLHLPQFFKQNEIESRDRQFGFIADYASLIVFSSRDAQGDFHRRYPNSRATVRILPFYWPEEASWFDGDVQSVRETHNVPESYLICCNQFWAHKDHATILRAMGKLERDGNCPTLVLTGATKDYRNPDYFPGLMKIADEEGIAERLRLLGHIPREDQIQLIRGAKAMVQPSRFEGWSTVVEDARALGKVILLSDLAVHREQNPQGARLFKTGEAEELAELMAEVQREVTPGPHADLESEARRMSRFNASLFARRLLLILYESLSGTNNASGRDAFNALHEKIEQVASSRTGLETLDAAIINHISGRTDKPEATVQNSTDAVAGLTRLARHYASRGQEQRAVETAQRAVKAGADDADIQRMAGL